MIRRRTPLKRSTKPIPRKRAKPRRGPLRDKGYRQFLRDEGKCIACSSRFGPVPTFFGGPAVIEAAHGPVNGMRSKGPDNEALPLCMTHHAEQHRIGFLPFVVKYGFDWLREAAVWYKAYQIYKEHTNVCEN